jgi:hypothetical protein
MVFQANRREAVLEQDASAGESIDQPDHARRRFLARTALATAGGCAAAVVPGVGRAATSSAQVKCPEIKVPMTEVEGKVVFITGGSSGSLPGQTLVIADTLISVSIGEQFWLSSGFELFVFRWPSLVQSLALSEAAKRDNAARSRSLKSLMSFRANGWYSLTEFQRWLRPQLRSKRDMLLPLSIALFPGSLLNALYVVYYSVFSQDSREATLLALRRSRFYFRNLRQGLSRG